MTVPIIPDNSNGSALISDNVDYLFKMFMAVQTTESFNDSDKVFTSLGSAAWEINLAFNPATLRGTAANAATISTSQFTLSNPGDTVPVTTGPVFNDLLSNLGTP